MGIGHCDVRLSHQHACRVLRGKLNNKRFILSTMDGFLPRFYGQYAGRKYSQFIGSLSDRFAPVSGRSQSVMRSAACGTCGTCCPSSLEIAYPKPAIRAFFTGLQDCCTSRRAVCETERSLVKVLATDCFVVRSGILTSEITGDVRLYRAASDGLMGWAG